MSGTPAAYQPNAFQNDAYQTGIPAPVIAETFSGGWRIRTPSRDDIRRERERLGILPKQAKIIDKALTRFEKRIAGGLADTLRQEQPRDVLAYIEESQEYRALMSRLALEAQQRQRVADYIAQQMLAAVMARRDEEDEIAVIMMMVH